MGQLEWEARDQLLHRRQQLSARAGARGADPGVQASDASGRPGRASAAVAREIEAIDEALARIADGRYGDCLDCGGPLGLLRLRAVPEARYCEACAERHRDPC